MNEHVTRRGRELHAGDQVTVLTPVTGFDGAGAVIAEPIPWTPSQIVANVLLRDRRGRHIVVNAVNVERED